MATTTTQQPYGIKVEDVPAWLILDGKIGHVLIRVTSGWHTTACGTLTPNGEVVKGTIPARKCRKCVGLLSQCGDGDRWRR